VNRCQFELLNRALTISEAARRRLLACFGRSKTPSKNCESPDGWLADFLVFVPFENLTGHPANAPFQSPTGGDGVE
jgi:hypothetical protein